MVGVELDHIEGAEEEDKLIQLPAVRKVESLQAPQLLLAVCIAE